MSAAPAAEHRAVVVVGHGAAGLSAAVAAAETQRAAGRPVDVLLLERADEPMSGGNTRWSPSYVRLDAPDRMSATFVADLLAISGGRADVAQLERLAAEAPATIAWLQSHGIAFATPTYYLTASTPRIQPVGGGVAVLRELKRAALELGAVIRYGCAVTDMMLSAGGSGAVLEVTAASIDAEVPPNATRLDADAVVLASGGFEGSAARMREHFGAGGETMPAISPGIRYNDGGVMGMAIAAGARTAGDWNGMHAEPIDPRSSVAGAIALVYPYGIVVDRTGRRFVDEGAGLVQDTWEAFARTIHFTLPGSIAYAILDASLFEIADYERAIRSDCPPESADTIAELAQKLGIDAQALAQTVAEYNAAAVGDASRFDATRLDGLATTSALPLPKSNWARPLVRAPFLAYPLVGAVCYTFGGLATDADARVLGDVGPLAGIYAAGEVSGQFYGTAPNAVSMLRALVFGRIAGMHAAA